MDEPVIRVATPPKMVCQQCGLPIFNASTLGVNWLHVLSGKAECQKGKVRRA